MRVAVVPARATIVHLVVACLSGALFASPATARAGVGGPAGTTAGPAVTYRLKGAIRHLRVHRQSHAGTYDRDVDFGDWVDQGGGCDTRAVVLKAESLTPTTQNAYCTVETGRWRSYYNATTYTDPARLQIDHVVPVENAWVSGAWRWTPPTRVAYYNDLVNASSLVAVDAHDNEAKGDQTPNQWLPPNGDCRYVRDFITVKLRWSLTVTTPEKSALTRVAATCPSSRVRFVPASVAIRQRIDSVWAAKGGV